SLDRCLRGAALSRPLGVELGPFPLAAGPGCPRLGVVERQGRSLGVATRGSLRRDGFDRRIPSQLRAPMTAVPPVLEVRELSKAYRRRPVLRGVSLSVSEGEAIAEVGPIGAGKSTFLRSSTGVRVIASGRVHPGA